MVEWRSAIVETVFIAVVAVALGGLLAVLGAPSAQAQDAEGAEGKDAFFEAKCNTCHAVVSADVAAKAAEKMHGPDLGGFVPENKAALTRYLRKEEEREGEKHKKTFKGTDEELATILAWLGQQAPAPDARDER